MHGIPRRRDLIGLAEVRFSFWTNHLRRAGRHPGRGRGWTSKPPDGQGASVSWKAPVRQSGRRVPPFGQRWPWAWQFPKGNAASYGFVSFCFHL